MSRQYLYAISDRLEAAAPILVGIDGVTPTSVTHLNLAAWVASLDCDAPLPSPDNLWRHEAVIEALMGAHAVLPVRFGTILPNESAAEAVLVEHYDTFCHDLERVRDRLELALHVLWDREEPQADEPGPGLPGGAVVSDGRSYLLARLQSTRREQELKRQAEALAMGLHAPLAALADDSLQRVLSSPRQLLSSTYLIRCDRLPLFRQQVEALIATHPELQFLLTGPWPAYSFITRIPGVSSRKGESS
jgi:hypothetical protein